MPTDRNDPSYYQRRVQRLAADPTLRPHGVKNTYDNWGCRCAPCTAARGAYDAARPRIAAAAVFDVAPDVDAPHGSFKAFNSGCRCEECVAFIQHRFGNQSELDSVI